MQELTDITIVKKLEKNIIQHNYTL